MRLAVKCATLVCLVAAPTGSASAREGLPLGAEAGAQQLSPGDGPAGDALRFYQRYLSSLRHGRCRFDPSCSRYAAEAIRLYGPFEGAARAADRLMRCSAASGRFYEQLPDGRLADPVGVEGGARRVRMPVWLLPGGFEAQPPPGLAELPAAGRLSETVSFADVLSREGDCNQAAVEFRRAAHLVGSPEASAWAGVRGGACYYREGDWLRAERSFLSSVMLSSREDARARATLMASACRFNLGDFDASFRLAGASLEERAIPTREAPTGGGGTDPPLLPVRESSSVAPRRTAALGAMGMALMAQGQWSAATDRFREAALASDDPAAVGRLRFLAARAPAGERLPRRSPGLALGLSAALPGAGQTYSGRTGEGLRHLLMNGALFYTVAQFVRDGKYPAAYVVAGFAAPFYLGNLLGARNAAREFNRSRRMEFVDATVEEASR